MRVLVCGGRDYADQAYVNAVLDYSAAQAKLVGDPIDAIIHGGAPGADSLAHEWAESRGVEAVVFKADWSQGRKAGPLRNSKMLAEGKPDALIAFPGGRGTADMVAKARAAGVPLWTMPPSSGGEK